MISLLAQSEATTDAADALLSVVLIGLGLLVFFVPTIIAVLRKHHNTAAIVMMNLLGGLFCGIGWIVALVWCFTSPPPQQAITIHQVPPSQPWGVGPSQQPSAVPPPNRTQPPAPSGPPAGWYPDPNGTAEERWWDGTQWSQHVQNRRPMPPPPPSI